MSSNGQSQFECPFDRHPDAQAPCTATVNFYADPAGTEYVVAFVIPRDQEGRSLGAPYTSNAKGFDIEENSTLEVASIKDVKEKHTVDTVWHLESYADATDDLIKALKTRWYQALEVARTGNDDDSQDAATREAVDLTAILGEISAWAHTTFSQCEDNLLRNVDQEILDRNDLTEICRSMGLSEEQISKIHSNEDTKSLAEAILAVEKWKLSHAREKAARLVHEASEHVDEFEGIFDTDQLLNEAYKLEQRLKPGQRDIHWEELISVAPEKSPALPLCAMSSQTPSLPEGQIQPLNL